MNVTVYIVLYEDRHARKHVTATLDEDNALFLYESYSVEGSPYSFVKMYEKNLELVL